MELVGSLQVSARGEERIARGHPWVFASDVRDRGNERPGMVQVSGSRGAAIGFGLFSPRSTIALRMFKRGKRAPTREDLDERFRSAMKRRDGLGRSSFRVVHGEADWLPGIFVDRYGDAMTLQTTCAGADALQSILIETLVDVLRPSRVVLRNNAAVRAREGLPQEVALVHGEAPAVGILEERPFRWPVDLLAEQKTGAFLDQVDNHIMARDYARGEALDAFCYHGGFALQLADAGCSKVVACDRSKSALAVVDERALEAGFSQLETRCADVAAALPEWVESGERFDTIVVDPPSFASTQGTVKRALAAYERLNVAAMKLLRSGGVMITCSCSGRVDSAAFDRMLESAASKSGRRMHLLERRGAGIDHPVLLGVPETEYLKCRVLNAV